jgi:hypothetical protein
VTCRRKGGDYIIGVDFNWDPQTRVAFKVFGDQQKPETWTLVAMDETISKRCDALKAARIYAKEHNGRYKGSVAICDKAGFYNTHSYGGKVSENNDAFYYAKEGFRVVAPIHTKDKTRKRKTNYSNPGVTESRTLVRELLRQGRLVINAGSCPELVNMFGKAPNRRKKDKDAGTYLDRRVYNLEDALRYVVWRVFAKYMNKPQRRPSADGAAIGADAA